MASTYLHMICSTLKFPIFQKRCNHHYINYILSESSSLILCGFQDPIFINSPTFFHKTIDKPSQKCGASRPLINKVIRSGSAGADFLIGGDLLKPYNPGGHAAYQEHVLAQLRKYYPDAASSLPASTWDIMEKFWALDLSELDTLMADRYSVFGPAPRLPSDMLRSILLSVEFKLSSYTKWAADLKENHLHAILSGFVVGDTPGVGTFYDHFAM